MSSPVPDWRLGLQGGSYRETGYQRREQAQLLPPLADAVRLQLARCVASQARLGKLHNVRILRHIRSFGRRRNSASWLHTHVFDIGRQDLHKTDFPKDWILRSDSFNRYDRQILTERPLSNRINRYDRQILTDGLRQLDQPL